MIDDQQYSALIERHRNYAWRKLVGIFSIIILVGLSYIFRVSTVLGGIATMLFCVFLTWIMFAHGKWADTNLVKRTVYLFHPGLRGGDKTELRMRQALILMMLGVGCYVLFTLILESL